MRTFLPFVVAGLTTGSVYALAAMGLVLTYKTSGVFNFAHGAIGTVAAYLFYELRDRHGAPWPLAVVVALAVVGILGGLALERLARRLAQVDLARKVVATIGLLVAVQGLATVRYGSAAIDLPAFLPRSTFRLLGVNVGYDQLIVFGLALSAAVALTVFLRRTRLGVAMRGVVDDPALLALAATGPTRVRRVAWILGSTFAAVSGLLLAPTIGLDSILLTLLVVQAFGAAAVGAFNSLPLAYAGALAIGVGEALITKYTASIPELAGLAPGFPFLVLFVVLLAMPRHRLVEATTRVRRRAAPVRLPASVRLTGSLVLVAALAVVPNIAGTRLQLWTQGLIFMVVFASLQLLVRTSGQVSICHAAFAAIGAATFANLAHGPGVPWLLALLAGGFVAVPVGAVVAVPAIRLSGIYLAIATFGFGILIERFFYSTALMFGYTGSRSAPRPHLPGVNLGSDTGYYYVVLAVAVVVFAGLWAVQRSRLGRLLRALAGSPLALETYGTSVNLTRVLVFCLSAFVAGVAGGLFAALSGTIDGAGFGAFSSLLWLTVLMLAGSGAVASPALAGLLLTVLPGYIDNAKVLDYQSVVFGAVAIAVVVASAGSERLSRLSARSAGRTSTSPVRSRRAGAGLEARSAMEVAT